MLLLLTTDYNLPSAPGGKCYCVRVTAGGVSKAKSSLWRRPFVKIAITLCSFSPVFQSCLLLNKILYVWHYDFFSRASSLFHAELSSHESGSWSHVQTNKTHLPWCSPALSSWLFCTGATSIYSANCVNITFFFLSFFFVVSVCASTYFFWCFIVLTGCWS